MQSALRPYYVFRHFELDIVGRELREHGVSVELAASAFDCLAYLILHRDRTIGRDELISATWGNAGTSDTTLAHTIVRLRRLFGDAGKEQHTIRTIPRVGYRWIAPIDERAAPRTHGAAVAVASGEMHAEGLLAPRQPRRRRALRAVAAAAKRVRRTALVAVAAAAAAACAALVGPHWLQREAAAESVTVTSVVLPADTDALTPEWSWLRFAVSDLVAARLSRNHFAATANERSTGTPPGQRAPANAGGALSDGDRREIQPIVTRDAAGWHAALRARDARGQPFVSEGRGVNAMEATRHAVDAFLDTQGHAAATADAPTDVTTEAGIAFALAAARAAAAQEQFDEAASRLGEARALAGHDRGGNARVDAAFGALLVRRQQPAMALPYLHRAVARIDPTGETAALVDALSGVGEAQLALRANEAALIATSRAWSLTSARDAVSTAAETHARALAACGDRDGARRLIDALRPQTPLEQARLQALRAQFALGDDDAEQAVFAATQAMSAVYARADRAAYTRTWIDKVDALQRANRSRESASELQRLTAWCGSNCESTQARRLALHAEQAIAEGRTNAALDLYASALSAADRSATPAVQTEIAAAYLDVLVSAGRMAVAVAVAGRLPERDPSGLPPRARTAVEAVRTWQMQFIRTAGFARIGDSRRLRRSDITR